MSAGWLLLMILIGSLTGLAWGFIVARRRENATIGILLAFIAGAAVWIGFVAILRFTLPEDFVLSMLQDLDDEVYIFVFEFIPAAAGSVCLALVAIPNRNRVASGYEGEEEAEVLRCQASLSASGYKISRRGASWIVREPLGGSTKLKTLAELTQYVRDQVRTNH